MKTTLSALLLLAVASVLNAGQARHLVPLASATPSPVSPVSGPTTGGTSVTITGTGFLPGASVTFGGVAASNVMVVNPTTITATTPSRPAGTVDVVVTNPNEQQTTFALAYQYSLFDANGDGAHTVGDVFYLINNLFAGGPASIGGGDANGDGTITVGDVFYMINYLFAGGPPPF